MRDRMDAPKWFSLTEQTQAMEAVRSTICAAFSLLVNIPELIKVYLSKVKQRAFFLFNAARCGVNKELITPHVDKSRFSTGTGWVV